MKSAREKSIEQKRLTRLPHGNLLSTSCEVTKDSEAERTAAIKTCFDMVGRDERGVNVKGRGEGWKKTKRSNTTLKKVLKMTIPPQRILPFMVGSCQDTRCSASLRAPRREIFQPFDHC
jgi:hypothetical protein